MNVPSVDMRNFEKPMVQLQITRYCKRELEETEARQDPRPRQYSSLYIIRGYLGNSISIVISSLINKTLRNNTVPQDWKKAIVSPIFKIGSKSTPGNYRPVSLTCVLCKITESIIKDHIMNHLEVNNLLTNCLLGFVGGKSCSTQLLECMGIWTEIMDKGGYLDGIYFDIAKAFDKVAHQRLLIKMQGYGMNQEIVKWTECFLTDMK